MENKTRFTKSRVIAFSLLSLLPVALIVLGIRLLFISAAFNLSFALAYFVLPIVVISLFALTVFFVEKLYLKIIACVLVFLFFVFSLFCFIIYGKSETLYVYKNEEVSDNYVDIAPFMPTLSDISQPEILEYYKYHSSQLVFFTCDTDTLICKYDEDEYLKQKELVSKNYVFESDMVGKLEHFCSPQTKVYGYEFKVLDLDEYGLLYPKELAFIATNDEENEILYMSFYDDDLDYIESLKEFIKTDCGFKHIR